MTKPKNTQRRKAIAARFTKEEHMRVTKHAVLLGLEPSVWLRELALRAVPDGDAR
jgi:uncharacterized protein (DUF2384 family)